jgi:hypothetical protein
MGGKQQKALDTLKEKISSTPVLALPNLRQPFEIQTDASNYAIGAVLLQHGKPICFHSETFNGVVINYPAYDKELYALVQIVKKWKHYFLGKKPLSTLIINHYNTYNHKKRYNMLGTSDGWVFYNSSTWSSGIRREFITKLFICFQGLLLVLQLFLNIVLSCMRVMLRNML